MDNLEKIRSILNPPLLKKTVDGQDWVIDRSVSSNLEACITDIENLLNDEVIHTSLVSILEKIQSIEKLLGSKRIIDNDENFNYMISPA